MNKGRWQLALGAWLVVAAGVRSQAPLRLHEQFPAGYVYEVNSRVDLSGTLSLPAEKGQAARTLAVTGKSVLDYQERVLGQASSGQVQKTVRLYRTMDFERQVGEQKEQAVLRPAVRRLVILRHKNVEVPFSPDGPLTWNEIDLVRTDVFTPALVGLLPAGAVRPGERWKASTEAVLELTDMARLDEGELTCWLAEVKTYAGRPLARVEFQGTVRGPGEDGPTRHELQGYLFFDVAGQYLGYLSLRGKQDLLDKDGKVAGRVAGTLVLTRRPVRAAAELGEAGLRGVVLEPNADNTRLLYDNPDLGVRFLYPRRWRVAGVRGRQVAVDEDRGSGLLLTVEPPARLPTGAQFLQESRTYLEQQKAKVVRVEQVRLLRQGPPTIEQFALEVETAGRRERLEYYVVRDTIGGVTVAARLLPADLAAVQRQAQQLVETLHINRRQ